MNQRFQNEDIRRISDKYAKDELYKAISSIGMQLEAELTGFGLCPEECFMEAKEVLSCVVEIREDIQQSLNTLWLRKYNEYRRVERNAHIAVDEDETRKVVGIVFGFAILATDSSQDSFYRHTLSECLAYSVAMHEFNGWAETLSRISSVPLADGWFDRHVAPALQVPDEENNTASLAQTNLIFNTRIFTTEAQYEELHDTILSFIGQEESTIKTTSQKPKYLLNPNTQAEWYYIMKAISESRVANTDQLTDSKFLRQMRAWFPSQFMIKEGEDETKMLRRYALSISRERQLWITGVEKHNVAINDMIAHGYSRNMDQAKILRLCNMTKKLRIQLQDLASSLAS